jgi:hypothetical protein
MKKALRIPLLLLLVSFVSLVSACTRGQGPKSSPEDERKMEKAAVEAGVEFLMQENGLTDLSKYADGMPAGVPVRTYEAGDATNDMTAFPGTVWKLCPGILRTLTTRYYYTVENDGTVRQFKDAAKTVEYNAE